MKKPISLILAVLMAFSSLSAGTAFAVDGAKTATIKLTGADKGEFVIEPYEREVSSDLSDKYADKVGYNDNSAEPTMLDAAIALHIDAYGEDFSDSHKFTVDPNGAYGPGITAFFGKETGSVGYWNNHVMSSGLSDTVKDGDYAYFAVFQGNTDQYVFADELEKEAYVGTKTEITFTIAGWTEQSPAAGLNVTVNGSNYGTTDANGKIKIDVDKIEEKNVIVKSNEDTVVFPACCRINGKSTVSEYINKEQSAAADFVFGKTKEFTVENSYDFLTLIRSGADVSAYKKGYVDSVKANLDANGGKITVKDGKEDFGVYGAVILTLDALGYSPVDFFGYNLQSLINNVNIEESRPHQYYYKYAVEAASAAKAKAIIQDLIDNYYTKGKGMNNWGYSCDNTCHFLITLAPYANDFEEYVTDAKSVIKKFLLERGAYCDAQWVKEENADSTALSMAAFASIGDLDTAFNYYKLLVVNFEDRAGIFTLNDKENEYATKDSLFCLYYMLKVVKGKSFETTDHIYKVTKQTPATCAVKGLKVSTCVLCNDVKKEDIAIVKHTPVTDKAVAATFKKTGKTEGSHCSVCGAVLTAQKTVKKLPAAAIKKLVKGKKCFTVKIKTVKNADGYEIQYTAKKNKWKKAKKVNIKKAKTAKKKIKKGIKSNKKYYVRIRTYKTINGKKEYSKWTKAKAVKTK